MKNRLIILISAFALIVAAIFVLKRQASRPTAPHAHEEGHGPVAPRAPLESPPAPNAAAPGKPSDEEAPVSAADREFQSWIAEEAKGLDSPSVDSEGKRREMKARASKFTASQSRQLRETALRPGVPAGQRILSAYLLVEGGGVTQEDLRQLIQAPLTHSEPQPAHSQGEAAVAQEKALRIMAIDGLASRAKSDPGARAALAQAAQESADPYVREYAQRRLGQL